MIRNLDPLERLSSGIGGSYYKVLAGVRPVYPSSQGFALMPEPVAKAKYPFELRPKYIYSDPAYLLSGLIWDILLIPTQRKMMKQSVVAETEGALYRSVSESFQHMGCVRHVGHHHPADCAVLDAG
ncbi:hypothetical protein NLX71_19835 [Paenibacillus sp. MZ04-78.2]|uniref:hypothetical protein n=1 Tax=Paenibacillus sp. MZ04-78.2 TaxID=2962034 RepID=UPI0020B8AA93|nr:hypothetical protein [Paenibacillus sp. MZ04-78.2]MCP3775526.1 hypothetical protein [Paenibacillus sp. MZ04-78.2]